MPDQPYYQPLIDKLREQQAVQAEPDFSGTDFAGFFEQVKKSVRDSKGTKNVDILKALMAYQEQQKQKQRQMESVIRGQAPPPVSGPPTPNPGALYGPFMQNLQQQQQRNIDPGMTNNPMIQQILGRKLPGR